MRFCQFFKEIRITQIGSSVDGQYYHQTFQRKIQQRNNIQDVLVTKIKFMPFPVKPKLKKLKIAVKYVSPDHTLLKNLKNISAEATEVVYRSSG